VNLCRSCGQDFGSLSAFDAHRVGVHAYTYSQGAAMTPIREDGRRCLTIDELYAAGWHRDQHGRWRTPRTDAELPFWARQSTKSRPETPSPDWERIGASA
jgi:hypothetical protein